MGTVWQYNEARKAEQDAKTHLVDLLNQIEYVNLRSEISKAIEDLFTAKQNVAGWEEMMNDER